MLVLLCVDLADCMCVVLLCLPCFALLRFVMCLFDLYGYVMSCAVIL